MAKKENKSLVEHPTRFTLQESMEDMDLWRISVDYYDAHFICNKKLYQPRNKPTSIAASLLEEFC